MMLYHIYNYFTILLFLMEQIKELTRITLFSGIYHRFFLITYQNFVYRHMLILEFP